MPKLSRHIACNLIYNNGGEDIYVGFKNRCTIDNIIYNVERGPKRWCSQKECSCRKYYDNAFKGSIEKYPCNESYLFEGWRWNAGSKFEDNTPFTINYTEVGKIAIFTTLFRGDDESNRKIVGFFKITETDDNKFNISGKGKYKLRLPLDEAKELNFWEYYRNRKGDAPVWSQGRFRYLEDLQVAAILHDIANVTQNAQDKLMVKSLLERDFPLLSSQRPNVNGALKEQNEKRILLKRKYGKGGESEAHKKLKIYISKNPSIIGLDKEKVTATLEHQYISGDLVDILFTSRGSKENTVVEIELDNVLPGIHQAIKYRSLRCSQLGIPLNAKDVRAVVVAWRFTEYEKKLCEIYSIDFYSYKL